MNIENLETQETRKPKLMRMNLQHFAEPGTREGNGDQSDANNTSNTNNQSTEKTVQTSDVNIDEVVNKALEKKEAAILKSVYLQQGMTEDEAKEAIADFKAKKAAKEQEESSKTENLLKAEKERADKAVNLLKETKLNTALKDAATSLGANPERLDLIFKLIDTSNIKVDENFNVDNDAVNKAIEKVLNDVPEFKLSNNNKNFGGGNGDNTSKQTQEDLKNMSRRDKWKRFYGQ